ncbi:MAG: hypothetical protein ACOC1F_00850 [Myxococcota bacterium]
MSPISPILVVLGSAVFAGLVATAVTLAIEKFGGVVGGFLGTLPTTIVPAAIGVQMNLPDAGRFADAMFITPAGMFLNAGFLLLWREVPPRLPAWGLGPRLAAMTAISLSAWLAAAVTLVKLSGWLQAAGWSMQWFGLGMTMMLASMGVLACLRPLPAPKGHKRVGAGMLFARGVLAAGAIAVAVWIAHLGGALASGVASVFPAIFLTAMVSLWIAQGEAVPAGAVGPMMLGSTSVATYALVASQTLPAWGVVAGSIAAWVTAASIITVPATLWLSRRRRRQATA